MWGGGKKNPKILWTSYKRRKGGTSRTREGRAEGREGELNEILQLVPRFADNNAAADPQWVLAKVPNEMKWSIQYFTVGRIGAWQFAVSPHFVALRCFTLQRYSFSLLQGFNDEDLGNSTVIIARMSHWKWRETKLQPSRAMSGHQISCCLVYLHCLCDILATITVQIYHKIGSLTS